MIKKEIRNHQRSCSCFREQKHNITDVVSDLYSSMILLIRESSLKKVALFKLTNHWTHLRNRWTMIGGCWYLFVLFTQLEDYRARVFVLWLPLLSLYILLSQTILNSSHTFRKTYFRRYRFFGYRLGNEMRGEIIHWVFGIKGSFGWVDSYVFFSSSGRFFPYTGAHQ